MAEETEPEIATGLIKSPQDFVGGTVLLAIAVLAYFAMTSLGSMRGFSFGAGTVPRLFCLILGLLSAIIIFSSFTTRGAILERFPWRGPFFIIASVVFFGIAIRPLGLAVSGVITVLLAGMAVDDFKLKEGIVFAVIITAFCAFLFPFALGQPIPLWPSFFN